MPTFTEGRHPGEFILSEDRAGRSRDNLTIAASQTILPGNLLGAKVNIATATVVASAAAGNTASSGTIAMGGTPLTTKAKNGRYRGIATAATTVHWEDPDGVEIGTSTHGAAFAKGGVAFTITAGGTPNVAGDTFYVDVTVKPSDLLYVAYDKTATDGGEVIRGIAIDAVTTGASETKKVGGIVRAAQVKGVCMTLPSGLTSSELAAVNAQLAKLGVIVR